MNIPFIPLFTREISCSLSRSLARTLDADALPRCPGSQMNNGRPLPEPGRPAVHSVLRWILKAAIVSHALFILMTSLIISAYAFIDPPVTVLSAYRLLVSGWKIDRPRPVKLSRVPWFVKRMVIAVEDDKFYRHWGFDLEAFRRAAEYNRRIGKPLYGGSTLTMQTARTLFLVPFKSYLRKYLELIVALELEIILSKDRILELYLSWAEWGKGVFGVDAASRHHAGISVSNLSLEQGARLVALLSSPIRYTPDTMMKSGILQERYGFLMRVFIPAPEPEILEAP